MIDTKEIVETKKTFCRFCHVFCGLEVDVQDNRVIAVRGDHDNPVSEGYTCPKGRAEVERKIAQGLDDGPASTGVSN